MDEYKVEHPKWELFSVKNEVVDVDFGKIYGSEFAFLSSERPYSVTGSGFRNRRLQRIKN